MRKTNLYVGSALLLLAVAAALHPGRREEAPAAPSFVLPAEGPLTLAATGDIVISRPMAHLQRDAAFEAIVGLLRDASIAIANLEMNLLAPETAGARSRSSERWAFGTAREAAELESLGIDLLGQANNHALDHGTGGMAETRAILTAAGLMTAGSGSDLEEARAPVIFGGPRRRLAVLAMAIASSSTGVATAGSAGSKGWPGINALRYAADVTADPETYETLRKAMPPVEGQASTTGNQFTLHGAVVRKGAATAVSVVPDDRDVDGILMEIARARSDAEVVVVSLHSHEPSNASEEPADFVRAFAHRAIEAGARLVVGHGPHRLRGAEVYKGGAILYSLGNFLYHLEEGRPLPADSYDTGFDMFSLAMGMNAPGGSRPAGADAAWWEGAVAVATFAGGDLAALELHPVDLGVDLPSRGIPRRPALPWAVSRLETLARLSRPFGTTIRIENGVGHVRVDGPPGRSAGHPRLDVLPRSGDRQSTPATVTITGPGSNMPPSRLRFEHSYWPRR